MGSSNIVRERMDIKSLQQHLCENSRDKDKFNQQTVISNISS